MIIWILAIIGFLLCIYLYYVEKRVEKDKTYNAVCDINDRISCSGVATSKYGSVLGFSNTIAGMVFYLAIGLLEIYGFMTLVLILAVLGVLGSIGFAYISYFKLKKICPVCLLVYIVNILLLVFAL